jgi:uncharacterized membrane protein
LRRSNEIRVTASIELDAPAKQVWAVLADYRHDSRWRVGVVAMDQDTPGTVRVGTVTTEDFRILGQRLHNIGVISQVAQGRSFRWRTIEGTDADGERILEALAGDRSRVTLNTTSRPSGFMERLLRPLIRPTLQKALETSLLQFRDLVVRPVDEPRQHDGAAGVVDVGGEPHLLERDL